MDELSRWMVWLALGFSVLVPVLGVLIAHQPVKTMLLTGLSLAFATIPEELPIIITMVLALGANRLTRQNAIVKRLKAVETLGAVTVIATDKTGTLTENRMQVQTLYPDQNRQEILTIGVLCNDATLDGRDHGGDPLEVALLQESHCYGLDVSSLQAECPLRNEYTFDNRRKRMSVVRQRDGLEWVAIKGAPESVLEISSRHWTLDGDMPLSSQDREEILEETAAQMAARGLRVIAFAEKNISTNPATMAEIESDLAFVGLAGLADPLRPEAETAVAECRQAGIRTVMITGDHPRTAVAIGQQLELDGEGQVITGVELDALDDAALDQALDRVSIFARTTPEHKLRIVNALKRRGERVAVTGDGTNDAPALVAADIGVAMGISGTDVAREAGDMVLADDNFATIVAAVREGRALFENLKKGVRYYLACKVALISITLLPVLLQLPVPFAPIQIILMELFMDLAAAAAFVAEPARAISCTVHRAILKLLLWTRPWSEVS